MKLSSLLGPAITTSDGADVEISGLTADSRQVRPGSLFVALKGTRSDGAGFISDAVNRGAAAILMTKEGASPAVPVPTLRTADPRRELALMAARFYGRQPAVALAVTGTSGKTSVAEFTRQLLAMLGHSAASLGTLGLVRSDGTRYGSLTTPDPVSLHETLDELAENGVGHVVFEASSHGIEQRRLDGVRLTAAAFTNLGRDHLDYHATMAEYLTAKLRLFDTLLGDGRTAVVNADDTSSAPVIEVAKRRSLSLVTTGRHGHTLRLLRSQRNGFAQHLTVDAGNERFEVALPLIGDYQASNALVAAGLVLATGAPAGSVLPLFSGLMGVPGRLEIVGSARGGLAVVDYAHKPEALAAALDALKPFSRSRLICVFGCGGDRDAGKRPIMGRIAAEKADVLIVTDDNPRSERPDAIRAAILAAAPGAREIGDRAKAIETAIGMLADGDVVLIAGKGHETGQIVGSTVLPFSDAEVVRKALERVM